MAVTHFNEKATHHCFEHMDLTTIHVPYGLQWKNNPVVYKSRELSPGNVRERCFMAETQRDINIYMQ